MSWCKFDDAADGDKMALAVAEVGDAAVAMWFRAVLHCSRNRTDGFVDARVLARLTAHKQPRKVAEALMNAKLRPDGAGLFELTEGGYMVHDYLAFNQSRAEADANDARNKADKDAARARAQAARDAKRTVGVRSDIKPNVPADVSEQGTESFGDRSHARAGADARDPVPSRPVPSHAVAVEPMLPWLDETHPSDGNLRSMWTEALQIVGIGTLALSASFTDQTDALRALWREACAAVPGITLGDVLASLTGDDPDDLGELRTWAADPARGKRWKPTEFLAWRVAQ